MTEEGCLDLDAEDVFCEGDGLQCRWLGYNTDGKGWRKGRLGPEHFLEGRTPSAPVDSKTQRVKEQWTI